MGLENSRVLDFMGRINYFVSSASFFNTGWRAVFSLLDIIIVAIVLYWIYVLFRETRGIRIIYGILFLIALTALGKFLQLSAFNFLLKYLSTMIIVAIPVVLQPELRSALERLGRANIVTDVSKLKRRELEILLNTITEATGILSHNRVGALIVIGRQTGLREYIESGTQINGSVSTELLLTIFAPKTALHDGAVIINGNKLVAAGCMLPLTDDKLSLSLGTRHRAALGLAAVTDAIVLIVSEESGNISLAFEGKLYEKLTQEELRDRLSAELHEFRLSIQEKR